MTILNDSIADYLEYCKYRKRLDAKTLKAYRIDLEQYVNYLKKSRNLTPKTIWTNTLPFFTNNINPKPSSANLQA